MQTNEIINLNKNNQDKTNLFSNIDAEQALIGSILWDNKNFEKVADFIEDKHFVDPNNQIIFKTISMLLNKNMLVSPITLKSYLPADDIDFDNPYQRSFSEYKRYKSTIFEDPYWLEDPIYYNLYSSNAQPQAERGIYIQSRYQFHEDLVGGIQWDSWVCLLSTSPSPRDS